MESVTIKCFRWDEIRTKICEQMGIDVKDFRNYHRVIGGEYKDLWHEWLNYFDGECVIDVIKFNDLGETMESKISWVKEDGKDWLEPFIKAAYKVWEDNEIEYVAYGVLL